MNAIEQFWITTFAVVVSPIIAVQIQKMLESIKEKRKKREEVFYALMRTRAARVSPDHVSALNRIDIEYYGTRFFGIHRRSRIESEVNESWRMYLDHLNTTVSDDQIGIWAVKRDELFTDLLYQLSKSLGYKFDKVTLKRGVYSPMAHGRLEEENKYFRQHLMKLFRGEVAFPINVVNSIPPSDPLPKSP
jgi:hypothetical protein